MNEFITAQTVWDLVKIFLGVGLAGAGFYFKVWREWKKNVEDKHEETAKDIAVLKNEVVHIKAFYDLMMQKMVAVMIHTTTPDMDKLLLRVSRGAELSDDEWVYLHDMIQHAFEEAIRTVDKERSVALAFMLSWIEFKRKTD